MKRRLQIFVSSTYRDLLTERQAAVEAILRAGHIPAGMELFAAGDKSQLETIYRWIDESDIYMLILGGRYGSIDKDSKKSYTQLEYEYAIATGKRFFAVVLTDAAIDAKVKADGRAAVESESPKELAEFRRVVTSKICRMVDDQKDIKLAIHETILEFLREYSFDGWVSGRNMTDTEEMSRELARLTRENAELKAELKANRSTKKPQTSSENDFDAIFDLLNTEFLTYAEEGKEALRLSAAGWFEVAKNSLVTGVSNSYNMKPYHNFLFFKLSPLLSIHGLTEDQKVAGVRWRTIKTTKKGNEFLVYLQKKRASVAQQAATAAKTSPTRSSDAAPEVDKPSDAQLPVVKPTPRDQPRPTSSAKKAAPKKKAPRK